MKQTKVRKVRKHGKRICSRKLNNGGMSLVEVVVAMTIFAVVTVPVLHALTTSALYNQKARKRQNVTALAESVMENFKGYSLDSLENEVFTGVAGAKMLGLDILNDSDISYTYAEPSKKDSAIKFQIQNVKSEKANYNIEINAVPSVREDVFEIDNVSTDRDAIFEYDTSYDHNTYDRVKSNFLSKAAAIDSMILGDNKRDDNGDLYTVATLDKDKLKILKREFLYKIVQEGDDYVVKVSGAYIYQMQKHKCYVQYVPPSPAPPAGEPSTDEDSGDVSTEPDPSEPVAGEWVEDDEDQWFQSYVHYMDLMDPTGAHDGYDNVGDIGMHNIPIYNSSHDDRDDEIIKGMTEKEIYRGKNLKRLLIYFYPGYKGSDGYDSNYRDMIKIVNNTSQEFDCYLIKQRTPGMSETKLTLNEQGYRPIVSSTGTKMRLFHNLDENLGRRTGTASSDIKTAEFESVENYTAAPEFNKRKVMTYKLTLAVKDSSDNVLTELTGTMYEKYREY
ncbi:MAG: prepilin-type N-terminal cleavage/methylation domain-containing protein [Lachnospiraceae bacterium]|nr:prepilin-type N-terminal cleavage/methylation domain-containing protein [Lachnospiraceae bacterium]